MVFTNYSKNRLTLALGGSFIGSVGQMLISTGSSTILSGNTTLTNTVDRQTATSIIYPTSNTITWQFDWASPEVLGYGLKEFGLITSGGGLTGSVWSIDVIPNIDFDGTNELRIEYTGEVF